MKLLLIDEYSGDEVGILRYDGKANSESIADFLGELGYLYLRYSSDYDRTDDFRAVEVVAEKDLAAEQAQGRWEKLAGWREQVTGDIGPGTINTEIKHLMPRRTERQGRKEVAGGPKITINHPVGAYKDGTALFTYTSKMNCASFSLAAGPQEQGGTCRPADEEDLRGRHLGKYHQSLSDRAPFETFICDTCYAGKGQYIHRFSGTNSQVIRYFWAEQALEEGRFVEEMVGAIRHLQTAVPAAKMREYNCDPRFFRIHDSGEFYSKKYYRAWVDVCREMRDTLFWAPTRLWVYPDWRREFKDNSPPSNLALRPSALFTHALPPENTGLAAGTMSAPGMSEEVYNCPAASKEGPEDGKLNSCTANSAGKVCRVCWVKKDLAVNYWTH